MFRDIQCSMDVGRMAELGRFAEEFTVYGYACWKDGEPYYRLSRDEKVICCFLEKRKLEGYVPTLVETHMQRSAVPSGMEEDIWQEEQLNLGADLMRYYSDSFLQELDQLGKIPATNAASALLENWREKLEGRFDRELQKVFDKITDFAFLSKQLTKGTYEDFCEWSRNNWTQMDDDVLIKDVHERTLYGFLFENDGKIIEDLDARFENVYRKRQDVVLKGLLATPIFEKTYWFRTQSDYTRIKQEFRELLHAIVMPCLTFIKELKQNASFIDKACFVEMYDRVQKNGTSQEYQTLKLYGYQWNCL